MLEIVGSHEVARANPRLIDGSRYALRSDLEFFEAPDGEVYLLGFDEDYSLSQPGPAERTLLRMLTQAPMTWREMLDLLAEQGDENEADQAIEELLAGGLLQVYDDLDGRPLPSALAERYDRQLAYFTLTNPGAEHQLQQRLAKASVVIVGIGGLGSWTAAALACAGIGRLVLIDADRVELSNLNRQVLFRPENIGALKVEVAASALRAFNPDLDIELHPEWIRDPQQLAPFLVDASLLVATADWPPHRISCWINEACVGAGVPYISAGQVPPFVRVGPLVIPGHTGCFECGERLARDRFPYYDAVVAQRERTATRAATLGPASAMVGAMLGMEILHHLTGISRPATQGCAVTIDLRSWESVTREIKQDRECPVCGLLAA